MDVFFRVVNRSELSLVMEGNHGPYEPVLFKLDSGFDVKAGDTLEFLQDGNIFKTSGTVQNYNGLQLACYKTILCKWEHWRIEL